MNRPFSSAKRQDYFMARLKLRLKLIMYLLFPAGRLRWNLLRTTSFVYVQSSKKYIKNVVLFLIYLLIILYSNHP